MNESPAFPARAPLPFYLNEELRRLILKRIISSNKRADSWPTDCLESVANSIEDTRAAVLQFVCGDPGWAVIDTGLAEHADDEITSGAWNLFTALCQPIPQYRSGELIHEVKVASRQILGASHYSQSNRSGGHHTDGALLDIPPDLAMLIGINTADNGGETVIVDGQAIAEEISKNAPAAFSALQDFHPFYSGDAIDPVVMHRVIDSTNRERV